MDKIYNLSAAFAECNSLEYLPDISKWKFKYNSNDNQKNSQWFPYNIDRKGFNQGGIHMRYLFYNCSNLKEIPDISKWGASQINDMCLMFSRCSSIKKIPDISKWDISQVEDLEALFSECDNLIELPDISNWNTSNVKNMKEMFSNCKELNELPDISKWNVSKVVDLTGMFCNCPKLYKVPDISLWNTINLKEFKNLFSGCSSLSSFPDLSKWNIDNFQFSFPIDKNISSLSINDSSVLSINSSLSENLSEENDALLKIKNDMINYNEISTSFEENNDDINYEYYQNFYN
jgi:surface protein